LTKGRAAMFEKVKTALRLKSGAFDDEVHGLIAAAIEDLRTMGVHVPDFNPPPDAEPPAVVAPRVQRAIILYCKGHFGYTTAADSARFLKAYDLQKSALHFERGRKIALE